MNKKHLFKKGDLFFIDKFGFKYKYYCVIDVYKQRMIVHNPENKFKKVFKVNLNGAKFEESKGCEFFINKRNSENLNF